MTTIKVRRAGREMKIGISGHSGYAPSGQDILGHSSINTTRIYIISTGAEHRQRLENMRLVI